MRKLKYPVDDYGRPNMGNLAYALMPGSHAIDTLEYLQNYKPFRTKIGTVLGVGCTAGVGFFSEYIKVAAYSSALAVAAAELLK